MSEIPPTEMTLDELRLALAPLIPAHATFDGWSDEALAMAAAEIGHLDLDRIVRRAA